jgi:hypothetical protein
MVQQHVGVARAIAASFTTRKLKSSIILLSVATIVVAGLSIWLVRISLWWLFLVIPVVLWLFVAALVLAVGYALIRILRPNLNAQQHQAVEDFVDKLERVADSVQTPALIIAIRIVWDAIRRSESTFIQRAVSDGATLHADYAELIKRYNNT